MKNVSEYINESFKSSIMNFFKGLFKKENKENKEDKTKENPNNIKIKGSLDNHTITLNKDELYNSIKKISENNNNKNLIFILCEMETADNISCPYVYKYKEIKNKEIILSKWDWKDLNDIKNNIDQFIKDLENIKDEELIINVNEEAYRFNNSKVVLERFRMTDFVCVLISFYIIKGGL